MRPPLSTHMPTWQSIALKARSLNSFTQANSENKGAVKSPFTSEEGRRGARGASSKPGHFPKKSLHPRELNHPANLSQTPTYTRQEKRFIVLEVEREIVEVNAQTEG